MAYTKLKDGGLSVKVGCTIDGSGLWTGGTEVVSFIHGLEIETNINGLGSASFWYEDAPFSSSYSYMRHGALVNIAHTVDSVTSYLFKGYIISDPRRGEAGERAQGMVKVECGGPLEVAKQRTDCAFCFTDCDPEWWVVNKRNNRVFNVTADDSIEIQVDKGEKVYSNNRGGIVGYVAYLGCGHMGGSGTNQFNNVKRIDGQVTTRLGDNLRARLLVADSYTDERDVTAAVYTTIKTWGDSAAERHLTQFYFDSNNFWSPPTAGKKYLALALYCTDVAGDTKTMTEDHLVRLDNVRVYTGTVSKRIDEGMLTIADWVNLHYTEVTSAVRSVVPNLVARPFCDPVSAMNQFAAQAECLVEWGWWATRATNKVEYRVQPMLTGADTIRNSGRCYTVDATKPGVSWNVRPRLEDGGDVRAVRLAYGRRARASDFPAGTMMTQISGNPGFSNTRGPFQGTTANVVTVDFTARNIPDEQAKRMAKTLARRLALANPSQGTVVARVTEPGTTGLVKSSDSSPFPWTYIQGGDFVQCTQDTSVNPVVVTRCHISVDDEVVSLEVGMPAETLLRQLEAAGSIRRAKLHRT